MSTTPNIQLLRGLMIYIESFPDFYTQIIPERKALLNSLADHIRNKVEKEEPVLLNFICTHNSRRSQIAQVWAATAAAYFGFPQIQTFSGGTEVTAFNPRAVAALERVGFQIERNKGSNPKYQVRFSNDVKPLICYSKNFADPFNPQRNFAAIMTCSDADQNCPYVPGAAFRLPLTYEDPKLADDTPEETTRYDERVQQIGIELFYCFSQIYLNNA